VYTPPVFQGTLLTDKSDHAGQLFRRNRYYDPSTGRFTQEDPIGLAGGMNLYGYAGGDPVNHSDPFGLMQCPPMCGATGAGAGAAGAAGALGALTTWASSTSDVVANTISAGIDAARDKLTFKLITYTRTGPNGQVYSGRTRGFGDVVKIANERASGHDDRLANFGPPVVDAVGGITDLAAIRGREQQLIDFHGGAQSDGGTSANIIRGVSRSNPRGPFYEAQANAAVAEGRFPPLH
jgi:RHS repeat-associated protein